MTLLALLLGCGGACETATCIGDRAVEEWPTDAAAVSARVLGLGDDYARTAVIARLEQAYPGATRGLCRGLPPGLSRSRCDRLNSRPHLSLVPGDARKGAGAVMGGTPQGNTEGVANARTVPTETPLLPDVRLALPALDATIDGACDRDADRAACLDHAAVEAALKGDVALANEACAQHVEARWSDECRFNAAERVTMSLSGAGYRTAAMLCGASTRYAQECWAHILTWLPRATPDAAAPADRARVANDLAGIIHATWERSGDDGSEAVGYSHAGRFWALYFTNVYNHTRSPDGTPLGSYSPEAWPHVRSALAMRLRATGGLQGGLDAQVAQLRGALEHREERPVAPGPRPALVWVATLGLPDDPDTVWFLGAARRPTSPEAELELRFVLLATGARATPPDRALLSEGAEHPEARVATEARRLLTRLDEGGG